MTPTVEQAIEIVRQLSPTDRKKFFDWFFTWIEEEKQKDLVEKENANDEQVS